MVGSTQHISFGWPRQPAKRLHIECPQALIHIEADHTDSEGRAVLYLSVSATQDAGAMPYVLVTGLGSGQRLAALDATRTASERSGLGLRLVQADHRHQHPATGAALWVGQHEECPFCRVYPDDAAPVPVELGENTTLRYLPVGAIFRPALGVFGLQSDEEYRIVAHSDGRGRARNLGILGRTRIVRVSGDDGTPAGERDSQDTLMVILVAWPAPVLVPVPPVTAYDLGDERYDDPEALQNGHEGVAQ